MDFGLLLERVGDAVLSAAFTASRERLGDLQFTLASIALHWVLVAWRFYAQPIYLLV